MPSPPADSSPQRDAWAVILAGGDGTHLRPFVEAWLDEPRPKQFCRFVGARSVLGETVRRASWP